MDWLIGFLSSNVFGQASNHYNALNTAHNLSASQVRQVYLSYTQATAQLNEILHSVDKHEAELGIKTRWTPNSSEYKAILSELHLRDYRHALDRLEYLVVQRMFELSKLGMSGVGKLNYFIPHSLLLTIPRV
jgi:hypothetical protein